MVDEKYGLCEMRNLYPTALFMGVQENSTGLDAPEVKIGIMLAGEIGVGGPISFTLAIRGDCDWKATFSQSARCTTSPLRLISPDPFFIKISCLSPLGSLRTMAALSGAREAVAPATITDDFDPWTEVAVVRSTVPVVTATDT